MKLNRITLLVLFLVSFCGVVSAQTAEELLEQGRTAYLNYDFSEASRLYGLAKKKITAGSEANSIYNTYNRQLNSAKNFLSRVEKIVIIDSITVPRKDFFKHYRLPLSAGVLDDASALPFSVEDVDYVFGNERDDYKLWSMPDSVGRMHLVESSLLTDGTWSEPNPLDDDLSLNGDAIFPFMMSDGVTLYYADNGDNSIGGYDIMVATRDAADGTFLQPSNPGFPYNSPYDDYLLAIDELNGVGWWATDRNQLDDELTLYVFIVNDVRQNYSPDEVNVTQFARIDDFIATQPEDGDYEEILATIREITPGVKARKSDFTLAASGGRIYHRYDELPDAKCRTAARNYFNALEELDKAEKELRTLRKKYYEYPTDNTASKIRNEESAIQAKRKEVTALRNELYKLL